MPPEAVEPSEPKSLVEMAHVLFMDIVSYSKLPMDHQREVISQLQEMVRGTPEFQRAQGAEALVCLPTGDGIALVFFGDPLAAACCARRIDLALKKNPLFGLRMGIHAGPVYRVADVNANSNVAGSGINVAQRVMDCGDAGHILLSNSVADVLLQLSNWKDAVHDLGQVQVKHGVTIHIFNLFTDEIGNPQTPSRVLSAASSLPEVPLAPELLPMAGRSKRVLAVALLALGLVLGALLYFFPLMHRRFADANIEKGLPKYLAILPIDHGTGEDATAGSGVMYSLSGRLALSPELRVSYDPALTKVRPGESSAQLAKRLGVTLLLRGAMREQGEDAVLTLTLTDTVSNREVWAREIRGLPKDLKNSDEQVYKELAQTLGIRETGPPQPETANPDAFELYQRGRATIQTAKSAPDIERAISFYKEAIKKDPEFCSAQASLAEAYMAMYRDTKDSMWSSQALNVAMQVQKRGTSVPQVHFSLGEIYTNLGRFEEAVAEISKGLTLLPNSDEPYRRLGRAYTKWGKAEEAIRAHERAAQLNPNYWNNHFLLGNAYFEFGENQKALEEFRKVAELQPNLEYGYSGMGAVQMRLGLYPAAIGTYKTLLLISDKSALAYSNLGTVFLYNRNYQEAIQAFRKAVQFGPKDSLFHANLGDAYRASGYSAEAQREYAQAVSLAYEELRVNSGSAFTVRTIALCYARMGNIHSGLEKIKEARRMHPDDADLLYDEAVIDSVAGLDQEAIGLIRKALQLGSCSLAQIEAEQDFDRLRGKAEFQAISTGGR